MKNIHILPTDKPSRLFIDIDDNKLKICVPLGGEHMMNQHIYITSNEEIKNGDWCINIGRLNETIIFPDKIIGKADYTADVLIGSNWRKIILTTDCDLIADSVQAIDDEFLGWFVKNPSCERVEINKEWNEERIIDGKDIGDYSFKIIIPREKPKQETLEKVIKPIGDFIIENATAVQGQDGAYYHYAEVCKLLKLQKKRMFTEEFILGFLEYIEGTYSYSNIFDHWYLHADTSKSFSRKELLKEYQKTILPPNKLDT